MTDPIPTAAEIDVNSYLGDAYQYCGSLDGIEDVLAEIESALSDLNVGTVPTIVGEQQPIFTFDVDAPEFQSSTIPDPPTVDNSPRGVTYTSADVTVPYVDPGAPVDPDYQTGLTPGDMPTTEFPAPDLNYPQLSPLTVTRGEYDTPESRSVTMGSRPTLENISLDAFDEDIAKYDDTLVTLPDYDPNFAAAELADPEKITYDDDAELIARIKRTLEGSDVLERNIQNMMYALQTERVDYEESEAVDQVFDDAAAAGFSEPLGAVNDKVSKIAYESQVKRHETEFSIRDETYDKARQLLLTGLTKAMALEEKHAELHISYAEKLVETYKFNVGILVNTFNAVVDYVNIKIGAYREILGLYNDYVDAINSRNATSLKQIEGELAKVSKYSDEVKAYSAQVDTVKAVAGINETAIKAAMLPIEEYKGYIDGVRANVSLVKQNLESYREAIGAYVDYIQNQQEKLKAYSAQVDAEASTVGVYEANVSAYSNFWDTESRRAGSYADAVQQGISALNAELAVYKEAASAQNSQVDAIEAYVRESSSLARAYSGVGADYVKYVSDYNRAAVSVAGAKNAAELATADAKMRNDSLRLNREVAQFQINTSWDSARTSAYSSIAQAANGIINNSVSFSCNNSTSKQASKNSTTSVTFGHSYSRNWQKSISASA